MSSPNKKRKFNNSPSIHKTPSASAASNQLQHSINLDSAEAQMHIIRQSLPIESQDSSEKMMQLWEKIDKRLSAIEFDIRCIKAEMQKGTPSYGTKNEAEWADSDTMKSA